MNEGAFLLSFYGFLYPSKGVETLLVATAKVIRDEPRVRVALIGAISDRAYGDRLYALADSLGISDRISWTGDCDPSTDDASVYLHASDVAVFPFREGARLNNSSLAVASAHGLPIISTLGSSLEPPLESGTNILLCRPDDPDALADIIIDVIRDDKLRDRLRGGSSTLHAEVFSWERCTAAILALLVPRQPGEPT